jgi:hypothetical protein
MILILIWACYHTTSLSHLLLTTRNLHRVVPVLTDLPTLGIVDVWMKKKLELYISASAAYRFMVIKNGVCLYSIASFGGPRSFKNQNTYLLRYVKGYLCSFCTMLQQQLHNLLAVRYLKWC